MPQTILLQLHSNKDLITLTKNTQDLNLNKEIVDERTGGTVEKILLLFHLSSPVECPYLLLKDDMVSWKVFDLPSSVFTFTRTLQLFCMTDQFKFNSRADSCTSTLISCHLPNIIFAEMQILTRKNYNRKINVTRCYGLSMIYYLFVNTTLI